MFFQLDKLLAHPLSLVSVGTVIVSIMAWRVSRLALNGGVNPILKVTYKFGDEALTFENVGKGPAIDVRLQRSRIHYVDERVIVEYKIPENIHKTIYENDTAKVEIIPDRSVNAEDLAPHLRGFGLNRFVKTIGTHKALAVVF